VNAYPEPVRKEPEMTRSKKSLSEAAPIYGLAAVAPARKRRVGPVVAASFFAGLVTAAVFAVVAFAGAEEHVITGTVMLAFRGILFKNAVAIEQSASLDTVVLDKTGTLTRGEPEVVQITGDGLDDGELLRLVAAVERESEHPLAEAIVKAAEEHGVERLRAEQLESIAGHGAVATVDGRRVVVGNRRLLEREHVSLDGLAARADEMAGAGRTVVHVAADGRPPA
jgi:Cu2+-exporting ATPase